MRDKPDGTSELWSKIAKGIPNIVVPLKETSIAGSTVVRKEAVNIPRAYDDPRFDPAWDKKSGYKTRSILCVPVLDPQSESCLGCLQLINKKDRFDRTEKAFFQSNDHELGKSYCSVVAIAVQTAHSVEVAGGCVNLAVNLTKEDGARLGKPTSKLGAMKVMGALTNKD